MAVTLQQIADACGVSRGTVDRALHGKQGIRPDVVEHIRQTAQTMGYVTRRAGKVSAVREVQRYRIGVVLHSASTEFVQLLIERLHRTAANMDAFGADVLVRPMDDMDVHHQLALIDELVQLEHIDGLALMPLASDLIRDRINDLSLHSGVPVVTLNTDIADSARIAYVGSDNLACGRAAAALMGLTMGGVGHVFPIIGQRGGHYADSQRFTGFLDEMEQTYPAVEVLPPEYCYLDRLLAERITLRMLAAVPDIKGIYISSVGRQGVYRALQRSGMAQNVHVVVHDLTQDNLTMIREGVVDFAIGQDVRAQGTLPIRLLVNFLSRKRAPKQRQYFTEIQIKFRCNLDTGSE